ncbi:MAG: chemotaxis protein CheX [Termitinemataceae bacterium]
MNQIIRKTFRQAVKQYFTEVGLGTPAVRYIEHPNLPTDLSSLCIIGIVGAIKGHLVILFPKSASAPIVQRLNDHAGIECSYNTIHLHEKETLYEAANQLSGTWINVLSEIGIDSMITPPTVLKGEALTALLPESDENYHFKVIGDFGKIFCILALKNSKMI